MSDHVARSALSRMHMREVAVAAHYTGFATDLQSLASADPVKEEAALQARRGDLVMAYGMAPTEQRKPFAFSAGIAIIPVHGSLINRFGSSYGSVTGYNFIRQQTALAGQDPDVLGIVYDHNSYGGEAAGCFECAADISRLANGKPTMAVVDSNSYSASYALAAGADRIVVTPSAGVGSIGVVAAHMSFEKMLDDVGIKVTFIHAGKHKVDGNPYEDLPDAVRADIQKSVDVSYAAFTGFVAERRKMDVKAVRATEARTYKADDALSLGLIDAVATPQSALSAFLGELSGSTSQPRKKEDEMSDANKPGAQATATELATAQAEAKKAERARVSGIQNCEEAKGREALAAHLAFNTDMSAEDAKGILSASPKAAAAETKPAPAANAFKEAMDKDKHPNVGADTAGATGAEQASEASFIIAAAKASGVRGFAKAA